ncbi:hypothetical protein [Streptomyces candidus]|uniref:Uncharacterized protein n=1 Tax=Streptomyces candidus TaxID=67283 RepID=A0A7X0HGG1_9ACTN|nr:hypothetical protein [Streptomyces candidus]MBB6437207.1 hypothetical protein [Streptomyces candidus]GHH38217.1 hypothetical protein GCM10018773_15840 [Streptomyces candidus]
MTTVHRPGASDVMVSGASGRLPGQWPAIPTPEELRAQLLRERARRELTLGSIRASFEEQPSANAVRAAARRWIADVLATAEDVAKRKMERST